MELVLSVLSISVSVRMTEMLPTGSQREKNHFTRLLNVLLE
jgi:hypothetical protein